MKIATSKLKKTIILILSFIFGIVVVVILFISPITKYLIEKYDEKYTGRQIKMDWAYVNPFTGYIHFSNLKIYEYKSDSLFISMNGLSANFAMLKLFSKTMEISELYLDQPRVEIVQVKRNFNFDDLVTTFSSKKTSDKKKDPFHFYFFNITIKEGHFYYKDQVTPVIFSIKNVNIESKDGWRWDRDTISAKVSLLSEIGTGSMKGNYSMNFKSLDYAIDVLITNFDLKVIEQYMK